MYRYLNFSAHSFPQLYHKNDIFTFENEDNKSLIILNLLFGVLTKTLN